MSPAPSLSLPRSIQLQHIAQINAKAETDDHHNGLTLDMCCLLCLCLLSMPETAARSPSIHWGTLGPSKREELILEKQ